MRALWILGWVFLALTAAATFVPNVRQDPLLRRLRLLYLASAMLSVLGAVGAWILRDWGGFVENVLWAALSLFVWWRIGGGDDVRKLRRRVTAAVARVGARLGVVPAPA